MSTSIEVSSERLRRVKESKSKTSSSWTTTTVRRSICRHCENRPTNPTEENRAHHLRLTFFRRQILVQLLAQWMLYLDSNRPQRNRELPRQTPFLLLIAPFRL